MKPHEILGIAQEASYDEAKAAYKRLAQALHPDRPGGDTAQFQALQRAFKMFKRSQKCPECGGKGQIETRKGLAVHRAPCPTCWRT